MQDIEDRIHEQAWTLWLAAGRKGRMEDYWNEAAARLLGDDDIGDDEIWRPADEERAGADRCAAGNDPEPEELDGPGSSEAPR